MWGELDRDAHSRPDAAAQRVRQVNQMAERGRVVVVSPHMDDGIFGCGQVLADHPGAVVVTAFAGRPAFYGALREWDAASGFGPDDDPIGARRTEDRAALEILGASPVWLDHCDAQYGESPTVEALADSLEHAILAASPEDVYMPLGLFHRDHRLTHEAAAQVARRHPELTWFAHEDAVYRRKGTLLAARLWELRARGVVLTPAGSSAGAEDASFDLKRRSVEQYRSQLRALTAPGQPGYEDAFAPEHYWKLGLPLAADGPGCR
jgi:LmbE family N-acetylglucosaminyl deacetylase